jgi:DNA polymerase-1
LVEKDSGGPVIYLVDGSSYIYRAFFAIRDLKTSQGVPTNAVYGFCTMLLKVLKDFKPEFLAVVLDARGPTFRHHIYELYKANRPEMPEDLRPQVHWIMEILRALRVPVLEKEGYEADDIIGTVVEKFYAEGCRLVLISGDKDLLQLVRPGVTVVDTMYERVYDEKAVAERYGVEPARLPDFFGLLGDTSDNIPGVPGIGEKKAREILCRFGTLENAISQADSIEQARTKEALKKFADQALLSKRLATIERDLPLDLKLEDLRHGPPDVARLRATFKALEFQRLLEQWTWEEKTPELQWELIEGESQAKRLSLSLKESGLAVIWLDERRDLPGKAPWGLGLMEPSGRKWYGRGPEVLSWFRELLEDEETRKLGHDLKSSMVQMARGGVSLRGIEGDVMVASYVANPSRRSHTLEDLSLELLDRKLPMSPPGDPLSACQRLQAIWDLNSLLQGVLQEDPLAKVYKEIELPLIHVLAAMELWGIRVEVAVLEELSSLMESSLRRLQEEIFQMAGEPFNINSPQRLAAVLFDKLKLPIVKKTKKGFSTDNEVLEELAKEHPLPAKVMEFRSVAKLKSTYVDVLPSLVNPKTGRIHTSFNQTVAQTGRLSSSNPNLQNIPARTDLGRKIRRAFVPEEGWWFLSADYSQVELRILAHLSGDPTLTEAFSRGEDIHARTASEILGVPLESVTPEMRREAKVVNFGIIYGMSAFGLAKELKVDQKVAQAYIEGYFQRYRGVKEYLEQLLERAREKGYVETLLGRRRPLSEIRSQNQASRKFAERVAINTPIQGTAADLIKKAMIEIFRDLNHRKMRSRMLLQVHDELLFEVPEEEKEEMASLVRERMETIYPLRVPLKVELGWGRNWAEAHP